GNDADMTFRDLEDAGRQRLSDAVRILHIGMESVAILARIPTADRAARLHEMRIDPADHIPPFDDMRRAGEGGLRRRLAAALQEVRDVVRAFVPDRMLASSCIGGLRHP